MDSEGVLGLAQDEITDIDGAARWRPLWSIQNAMFSKVGCPGARSS